MLSQKEIQSIDDEMLIKKIVSSNNTHFFGVLYDRYSDKVYAKCLSFAKSEAEAQDLTHDIFIQLFLKLKTFKGNSKFSTWLYSLTYNFCLNYVQRDQKKKRETFKDVETENLSIEDDIPDSEIFQMKAEKLQQALSSIDPGDKMILLMKYQDDFSIQEIKESLNLGESAVKMRIKRAKERLIDTYQTL